MCDLDNFDDNIKTEKTKGDKVQMSYCCWLVGSSVSSNVHLAHSAAAAAIQLGEINWPHDRVCTSM